jgi:hypothetical protein
MSDLTEYLNGLGSWFLNKKNTSILIEKYNNLPSDKKKWIDENFKKLSNEEVVKWINEDSVNFNTSSLSKTNDVPLENDMILKKINDIERTVKSNNLMLSIYMVLLIVSVIIWVVTYFKYS